MTVETVSKSSSILSNIYSAKEIETEVREKWMRTDLRQRVHQKFAERKVKPVGYVDGPPTLNGEPHMGHLRGRVIKDLWFRFETLRGVNIDFRGGWDCQGLPVELQAEKELGLTGNKTSNLKAIGEEALVATCKKMVQHYHLIWQQSDEKIGLMIDDEKAYWTYRDPYIEREWQILRAAWDNQILAEGYRVTPFCPNCQTSLSAGEVALGGYENLEDPSLYFKMRLRGEETTFLIAWTTMPFTVITDELVGAKPASDYFFVKVTPPGKTIAETWIVGALRLEPLMKELRIENYVISKAVKGKDLEGLRYDYPLVDLVPEQARFDSESAVVHSIVAEDFVDDTTGSGLVHMAPANGEDDFEVSRRRNVPVFNPIDDQAVFTEKAGAFSGLFVRDADQKVSDALKERGALLRYGKIKHEYPICWRSGHRLVWLARREYFYFVERLKEMAVEASENTEYFYEPPRNRFVEIVKEKRPWCISRERVWGTPLPIWKCAKCNEKLGLFSRSEILEKAKALPDGEDFELHRPWIDRVKIQCPKCDSEMTREPFVLDTWHNSGAAPFAAHTDIEYHEYIPLPFLTEGIDQTRGWAYSLLIENVIQKMKPQSPYRAFLFQGHVLDAKGEKLSKSKGNFVPVRELLEENSVDLIRLYLNWKSGPIESINFAKSEMITRPYQILSTLYHMHVFYFQNANFDGFVFDKVNTPKEIQKARESQFKKQDLWLVSRLGLLIDLCTIAYSKARYHEAARAVEKFLIEDLSQTYVPIIRGEMVEEGEETKSRRRIIYSILGLVLFQCNVLLHPIAPFVTDYLAGKCFGTESVLLENWPESEAKFRDTKLEVEFDLLSKAISLVNSARMKAKLKRRWPLREAFFLSGEAETELLAANENLLREQTNVTEVKFVTDPKQLPVNVTVKPNYELLAPKVKNRMTEVSTKLAKADAAWLFNEISKEGKATLPDLSDIELTESDLNFNFGSADPRYVVVENFGIVVALDTSRDNDLIARGLVKDVARNVQALRKEKGFNPTDVLELVRISRLGEQNTNLVTPMMGELAFLVRVKKVEVYPGALAGDEDWNSGELDGAQIKIEIS